MGLDGLDAWGVVVREIAARQAGTISRRQLLSAGLSRTQIQDALLKGRLHPFHRGVYSLLPLTALAPLARHHAALLACGPNAVLSHDTAAHLLGLTDPPSLIADVHVTTIDDRHHSALICHRTNALPRHDTTKVGRLWVTNIPRTVHDLARTTPSDRAFERVVDEALGRVSAQRLIHIPRVKALLGENDARASSLTWSENEEKLRQMIKKAELPPPESNVKIGRFHPDLLWRDQRLIVEYDSYRYHSGPGAFYSDRERHNHFEALGYHVLHVTLRQLKEQRELLLVQIATTLVQRP
jgi:very-short-patch-repair endonuclease